MDRQEGAPDVRSLEPGIDKRLARRDAILNAVARAAERLSESGRWQEQLPDVLGILGNATRVSRVYLFEVRGRPQQQATVSQRFEWVAEGVTPQIDNPDLQEVPLDAAGYSRWAELLEAGQPVYGDIDQFPPSERPLLQSQQILSLLVEPVFSGPRWWGFIGFDACAETHSWEKTEVDALRIVALILGSSIHRQEREASLRETQKLEALGRMAGGIAHDFNNVLTVVGGGIELLRDDLRAQELLTGARPSHFEMIERSLTRAATLNRRLLEFSRQRETHPRVVSAVALVRSEEPLLRQAVGSSIRLRIAAPELPERAASILVDPVQFAQVLLNLSVNARDAMPKGGELLFEVSNVDASQEQAQLDGVPSGQWTRLRVVDSGIGMSPEVRERIFDPYFTTKHAEHGSGLGLSTVYGIVTGAGGRVAVTSALGSGTEFRIYFPAFHAATADAR